MEAKDNKRKRLFHHTYTQCFMYLSCIESVMIITDFFLNLKEFRRCLQVSSIFKTIQTALNIHVCIISLPVYLGDVVFEH